MLPREVRPNPSLERDLHRHGTWPARRSWPMLRLAGQAPSRFRPLSSNVRPHRNHRVHALQVSNRTSRSHRPGRCFPTLQSRLPSSTGPAVCPLVAAHTHRSRCAATSSSVAVAWLFAWPRRSSACTSPRFSLWLRPPLASGGCAARVSAAWVSVLPGLPGSSRSLSS